MADETTYARIVLRNLDVIGIDDAGNETVLYEGTFLGRALEEADRYAWLSGVTYEREIVDPA